MLNKITIIQLDDFRIISEADDADPEAMLVYGLISQSVMIEHELEFNKAFTNCLINGTSVLRVCV